MNLLTEMPCSYIWIGVIWSAYQGVRGAVETHLGNVAPHKASQKAQTSETTTKDATGSVTSTSTGESGSETSALATSWATWQKWVVLYIHDFAFRFICTLAGFVALYAAYAAMKQVGPEHADAGLLVFVAFAFLLGVIGVGGQLHHAVLFGKLPGVK